MSRSEADTERIAVGLVKALRGGETLLLSGPLGAGKTVFVRGLAKDLGVRDRITSPTFILMRVHEAHRRGIRHFVHVDAYRVSDPHELETIGLPEWIGRSDAVVVIEWGERARALFRRIPHRVITLRAVRGATRTVTIREPARA